MRKRLITLLALCVVGMSQVVADVKLVHGDQYAHTFEQIVLAAEQSVYCCTYVITEGGRDQLFPALYAARNRGVKVVVVLEQGAPGSAIAQANQLSADLLRRHGIQVLLDSPRCILHAKAVVVDTSWVLTGSTDWTESALGVNLELNVLIRDDDIAGQVMCEFFAPVVHRIGLQPPARQSRKRRLIDKLKGE
jgi:phosphatidylserine/phosphatidylglycerophosphate/cardiolipin synthase-like enzyme